MTIVLLIIATLALVVATITALALVEVLHGLEQLRKLTGFADEPVPVDLGDSIGTTPAEHGLLHDFDGGSAVLLFLSPKCQTCYTLAESFAGGMPKSVHTVVTAASVDDGTRWATEYEIPQDRLTVDDNAKVADSIGIDSTPVAVLVHSGRISRALTAPSRRVVEELVREIASDRNGYNHG